MSGTAQAIVADPATGSEANAAAAIIIGVYLALVFYRGNIFALGDAVRQDFLGTSKTPAFWRWSIALLVLIALSQINATKPFFGYALVFALVAMLINTQQNNPKAFNNLLSGLRTLYTGSQPSGSVTMSVGTP